MTEGTFAVVVLGVCFGTLFGVAALLDRRTRRDRPRGISPVTSAMLLLVALVLVLIALTVYFRTLTFAWAGGGILFVVYVYRRISSIVDVLKTIFGKQD